MSGRLTFFKGTSGKEEVTAKTFREQVVPPFSRQPGFAGFELLLDRHNGRGIATGYFADASSLEASQPETANLLDAICIPLSFTITGVIEGEIRVADRAAPPREGTWSRLRIAKGQGDALETGAAMVGEKMVPFVRQQPGYRSTLGLINHSTGDAIAVSAWDTRKDLEAAGAALSSLRGEASVRAPMTQEESHVYEIVVSEMPGPTAK